MQFSYMPFNIIMLLNNIVIIRLHNNNNNNNNMYFVIAHFLTPFTFVYCFQKVG